MTASPSGSMIGRRAGALFAERRARTAGPAGEDWIATTAARIAVTADGVVAAASGIRRGGRRARRRALGRAHEHEAEQARCASRRPSPVPSRRASRPAPRAPSAGVGRGRRVASGSRRSAASSPPSPPSSQDTGRRPAAGPAGRPRTPASRTTTESSAGRQRVRHQDRTPPPVADHARPPPREDLRDAGEATRVRVTRLTPTMRASRRGRAPPRHWPSKNAGAGHQTVQLCVRGQEQVRAECGADDLARAAASERSLMRSSSVKVRAYTNTPPGR